MLYLPRLGLLKTNQVVNLTSLDMELGLIQKGIFHIKLVELVEMY